MATRKMFSRNIELRVLRTLCLEPEGRPAQDLLAKLDESHFASETARATYRRIRVSLRKSSIIPDWLDLCDDPHLDESIREELEDCCSEPLEGKTLTRKAISRLDDFKKMRLFTKIGAQAARIVNGQEPVDIDAELAQLQGTIAQSRSAKNFKVLRIGKNSNAMKHVDKLLAGTSISYIPTGFAGFDSINRGIPAGSFMLIGSPTGSGKSLMASQLGENMARQGAKVGVVPLEMVNNEMLQRQLARVGDIDMTKLLDPIKKMSRQEHEEVRAAFEKYDARLAKAEGSIEFYEFDEDVSIETVTATVKPFGLDVLIIDYLGLLDGANGDDQWRALMNIARYCHIWGKANGVVVIAACQLSEEGMLRYAKGMGEHAKYFWTWVLDEVARTTGIAMIKQQKARQASDHPFPVQFDFPRMAVKDADKEAMKAADNLRKEKRKDRNDTSGSKWKQSETDNWDGEENKDEDDDTPEPKPGPRATSRRTETRNRRPTHKSSGGGQRSTPKRTVNL